MVSSRHTRREGGRLEPSGALGCAGDLVCQAPDMPPPGGRLAGPRTVRKRICPPMVLFPASTCPMKTRFTCSLQTQHDMFVGGCRVFRFESAQGTMEQDKLALHVSHCRCLRTRNLASNARKILKPSLALRTCCCQMRGNISRIKDPFKSMAQTCNARRPSSTLMERGLHQARPVASKTKHARKEHPPDCQRQPGSRLMK